jgi:catechol 2,3-dioxygenase
MVTLALDTDDLLAQAPGVPNESVAPGTSIGHVHLKVADVPRATAFYRDALGFEEQALLPSAAFLSAGGYHHHIGLNSWQSAGASASPASAPGLREIGFELGSDAALETLRDGLAAAAVGARARGAATTDGIGAAEADAGADAVRLADPDGIRLSFASAPGIAPTPS